MYPIRLIAVGRLKLDGSRALEQHYHQFLRTYARLESVEIPEGKGDVPKQLREEGVRIRSALEGVRSPILLDPSGALRDSDGFALWLKGMMDRGERLAFVIGSSHGVDPDVSAACREKLSLSPMTMPHDLCRVVFLEQLYRAFTILRGKSYHK